MFTPDRPMQSVCGPKCAYAYVNEKKVKAYKAETRTRKKALNSTDRQYWLEKAKKACHKYIRTRDADLPCISCGTTKTAQWDAGHYRPAGNNSFLRFCEVNINKQCCTCNDGSKLSGNLTNYRIGLVRKIGAEMVEWLEGPQPTKRWDIEELKQVIADYKEKLAVIAPNK